MVHEPTIARPETALWKKLRRVGHYVLKVATLVLIAVLAVTAIGFFRFADRIANLTVPTEVAAIEAIVALTGGSQRLDKALELLEDGVGKRLLISGANPSTSSAAIKRATGANEAMFNCCVDIGYQAIDTIGNANEAAGWIRRNGYHQVLVVTNNYHIPRSLLELGSASPDVAFTGYPVTVTDLRTEDWMSDPIAIRTLMTEYFKYSIARLRSWAGAGTSSGLRVDIPEAGTAITASVAD